MMDQQLGCMDTVEGWLSNNEGQLLYSLAKSCTGKGVVVEIGSWKGKSTICLAKGSNRGNNVKVYAIDPHYGSPEHKNKLGKVSTFEEFERNVSNAKISDLVIPVLKTSEEAAKNFDKPVEILFIDGNHDYEFVKLDFNLWFPKVMEGGIIAFHDATNDEWPGPKEVVMRYILKSEYFSKVNWVDTTIYGKKIRKNSFKDRLRNRYILFLMRSSLLSKFDKVKGKFGIFLKRNFPRLHIKLKHK